jgi:hypothetical protein
VHTMIVIVSFEISCSIGTHNTACGVVVARIQIFDLLEGITKGASGSEQHDRKDDRLEKARVNKRDLEYLQTEFIGSRLDAPLGHCETGTVGRDQLRWAYQHPQDVT